MKENDTQLAKIDEKMPIRVMIGIACQDIIEAKTLGTIMGVLITSREKISGYIMRQGCDIVSGRTYCVQYAREKGATHIFFVDSDMEFPANTLERLLKHDKDIVTVEYSRRQLPPISITHPLTERSDTELYKADGIGGGCLLIRLSVFERIDSMNEHREPSKRDPYFNFGRNDKGMMVIGEDTWFCNVARDAGIDSWIDPTIKVAHIGEFSYVL